MGFSFNVCIKYCSWDHNLSVNALCFFGSVFIASCLFITCDVYFKMHSPMLMLIVCENKMKACVIFIILVVLLDVCCGCCQMKTCVVLNVKDRIKC